MVNSPNRSTMAAEAEKTCPLAFNSRVMVRAPISEGVRLSSKTPIHKNIAVSGPVKKETTSNTSEML